MITVLLLVLIGVAAVYVLPAPLGALVAAVALVAALVIVLRPHLPRDRR